MRSYFSLVIATLAINTDLFAAEAGMPQLDPKYWASQAFWLILIFTILYISIAKLYLPKIKNNLDNRENRIKNDLDDANKFKDLSAKIADCRLFIHTHPAISVPNLPRSTKYEHQHTHATFNTPRC